MMQDPVALADWLNEACQCVWVDRAQLRSRLLYLLDEAGYPQHPQLEGAAANKKKRIFS